MEDWPLLTRYGALSEWLNLILCVSNDILRLLSTSLTINTHKNLVATK